MADCQTPRTAASTSLALPYTSARRTLPYKRTPHSRRIGGPKHTSQSPVLSGRLRRSPANKTAGTPGPLPGLTNKTWNVFRLTPLYGFSTQPSSLKRYGRSFSTYLMQDKNRSAVADGGNGRHCIFSIYEGIQVNAADPEAVQILVTNKNSKGQPSGQPVLTAVLCGVDLETDPCNDLRKHFIYYPILLVKANVSLTSLLNLWLERHFDCCVTPLNPTSMDLAWMVSMWGGRLTGRKSKPVELLYTVPEGCEGMSRITYTIDPNDCKAVWDSIHTSDSDDITEEEVGAFLKSLEEHFYECFKVKLWKMELTRIGTAVAIVGDGRLKIFSAEYAWQVLRLMSELSLEQFQTLARD